MASWLNSIDNLRGIEWGRTYLWDIQFPDAPAPFSTWFPAVDYTETINNSNPLTLQYYLNTYKFPESAANTDITMTIHDDVNGTLLSWLTNWYASIYSAVDGVAILENAVKQLNVQRLDITRQPITQSLYWVFPEGSISDSLDSNSNIKTYTLSFTVVGSSTPTAS